MRLVAIALVLVVTLLQLLLGVTHILGSSYTSLDTANTTTNTTKTASSPNAGSLVGAALDRAPPPPSPRTAGEASGSQLLLGVLCLAVVVVGLAAIVVLARRRGKRIAVTLLVAGCGGSLVQLVAAPDGATLTLLAVVLLALALGAGLLARWRPAAAEAA